MKILSRLAHGPNPVDKPVNIGPEVLELSFWTAHQFCYGSFVGFKTPDEPGFDEPDSQHLGIESREISGPKATDLGLKRLGKERC